MKKIVAGMMNALLLLINSLKAEVRSTRTHSFSLCTLLLSGSFPTALALYGTPCIQSSVYASAYTNAHRAAKKTPGPKARGVRKARFWCAFRPGPRGLGGGDFGTSPRRAHDIGDDRAGGHNPGEDVEGQGVALGRVEDRRDQERPGAGAGAPRGQGAAGG